MKRWFLMGLLGLPLAALAVSPGQLAPAAAGSRLAGEGELSLQSLRGKVVLVDFFASWCGPCALSLPALQKLRGELQGRYPGRFELLAINVDDQADAGREFLRRRAAELPAIFDAGGRIASLWELPGMPSSFLIDAQGRIVAIHAGFRSGDEQKLRAQLLPLLDAAKPP